MLNHLTIDVYSKKKFAVYGDSKLFFSKLKSMNGKWHANLRNGDGWVFNNKHYIKVKAFLDEINDTEYVSKKAYNYVSTKRKLQHADSKRANKIQNTYISTKRKLQHADNFNINKIQKTLDKFKAEFKQEFQLELKKEFYRECKKEFHRECEQENEQEHNNYPTVDNELIQRIDRGWYVMFVIYIIIIMISSIQLYFSIDRLYEKIIYDKIYYHMYTYMYGLFHYLHFVNITNIVSLIQIHNKTNNIVKSILNLTYISWFQIIKETIENVSSLIQVNNKTLNITTYMYNWYNNTINNN
jgi:hypothetical protein